MAFYTCIIFTVVLAFATAKVAKISGCDTASTDVCTVSEVRITPCTGKNACNLKKGNNASITFDFTPNFAASKLKAMVYWVSPNGDIAFADMTDDDGCKLTTCPVEVGKTQVLEYNLYLGTKLPSGFYDTKWKVWNEANEAQQCCFTTVLSLKK